VKKEASTNMRAKVASGLQVHGSILTLVLLLLSSESILCQEDDITQPWAPEEAPGQAWTTEAGDCQSKDVTVTYLDKNEIEQCQRKKVVEPVKVRVQLVSPKTYRMITIRRCKVVETFSSFECSTLQGGILSGFHRAFFFLMMLEAGYKLFTTKELVPTQERQTQKK